jgi:hypothetical protein
VHLLLQKSAEIYFTIQYSDYHLRHENWYKKNKSLAYSIEVTPLKVYKILALTLKRGPGSMLLVEAPRVLLRLPFRGLTQMFVESRSPLVDMFNISPE